MTQKKKNGNRLGLNRLVWCLLFSAILAGILELRAHPAVKQEQVSPSPGLLQLLGLEVSPESLDYVQNKTQFQLHTLLTEQRHPKTWNLSERIKTDVPAALHMLFSVDEDIVARLEELATGPGDLQQLSAEIKNTIRAGHRIYIYGCGATGRLAKQMESSFWRPFWNSLRQDKALWTKIEKNLSPDIADRLTGEMTGGDRALISSLEGFEDLQLIGRLQLQDHGIKKGDLVICITEGGETSSVIGTILVALEQWKDSPGYRPEESRKKLYFIYNNPDDRLRSFDRSRSVIEEPGITRINLTTGPMAITGSTRMQATTIETYVVGAALQAAVYQLLSEFLSVKELQKIGFSRPYDLVGTLKEFQQVLSRIRTAVPQIADWTALEARTYAGNHFSTYFAGQALITVFIDSTERSPTFRLFPLDTVEEQARRCWIQVWTPAGDKRQAWLSFLGRPFCGLREEFYRTHFEEKVEDPYLKRAALESLKKAGNNQQELYDFAFDEFNLKKRGPQAGDLGVIVCLTPEEKEILDQASPFNRFIRLFLQEKANVVLVSANDLTEKQAATLQKKIHDTFSRSTAGGQVELIQVWLNLGRDNDPFHLKQNVGLKMVLNAHSTAVMARLGRVIGNTMTNVSPSNLKLIGRATYLIQSHVNDRLRQPDWIRKFGHRFEISYAEANAVLFDSIAFLRDNQNVVGQTAEVALSIIRILESIRQKRGVSNEEALAILQQVGLADYLSQTQD